MLDELLCSDIKNTVAEIEKYVRKILGLNTCGGKNRINYWMGRGWSYDVAYVNSKKHTTKGQKSPYSRKFWLEKINPTTNKLYTIEEADFERNSRRPIRKEYWIKKGYNDEDALQLAFETKNKNNKKGAKNMKISPNLRVASKRCIEYYTARGYSEEEAANLLAKEQTKFSKEICIEKYGEDEGIKIWQDRQDRWQETLNSKSSEEITRINKARISTMSSISKAEKEIIKELEKNDVGHPVNSQFVLFADNNKRYVYDISVGNKIIEYNGDFWHCNPTLYNEGYINPRTKEKSTYRWKKDKEKIKVAEDQGYEVLVIWESEYKQNKEDVIKQCIQFLKQ